MARIRWYGPTLLLLATVILAMAFGPSMVQRIARSYETARIQQVRKDLVENPTLNTLSDAFKDVATVVRPSVTSISLQARERVPGVATGRMVHVSNGSGWVYRYLDDRGGYRDLIITNNHVVEDLLRGRAEQAIVRFDDGGEYRARVVGTDKMSDVAVLEIDRRDMVPMALATDRAEQGEIVFAVGSPFQFEFSMSQGIVSATGRRLRPNQLNTSYENFIQTDAAINPGNSGGPLTNVRGEVIGMNTAIAVEGNPQATFSGLGFAIPIDQVIDVANKLIEDGEVKRGYIGVYIYDVDYPTAQAMNFDGKGVLCEPLPGGPADLAGVELGDIITHVGGRAVGTAEELRIAVSSHTPGSEVPIRVWRRGRSMTLQMQLVDAPTSIASSAVSRDPFRRSERVIVAGVGEFGSYTPAIAMRLGRPYIPGAMVLQVDDASTTDLNRLVPMQIVSRVNGQHVNDQTTFADAIDALDRGPVTLRVYQWEPIDGGRYVERTVELQSP